MRTSAIKQFQISDKEAAQAASFRRGQFTEVAAIKEAAQEAARLSIFGNLGASYLWADVAQGCELTKTPIENIVFHESDSGRSLAEQVLRAEDWLSARIIAACLKDKTYDNGKVIKKDNTFFLADKGDGTSLGIKMYPSGALYGGQLKDGLRQGFGVFDSANNTTYCGDWFDDKKEGHGCSEMTFPRYSKQEGIFSAGIMVEPKKVNLWTSFKKALPRG